MTWSKATLGHIADEVGGSIQTGPFGSQLHQSDYQSYGTPVVMPQNIVNDKITEDSIAYVDDVMVRKLSRHVLQVGDIVYPRRGELNKRAIISEKESGWLCGTGCVKISLTNSPLLPSFLFYYLKQSQVVKWIENKAVGSTMLNLNTGILRSVEVQYPNYQTQQYIAGILSNYDRLIDNNNRRIALLEESIHQLYKEWFVRLHFPGYESVKVIDGIPEGWSKATATQVIDFNPKTSAPKGEVRPYLPMEAVSTNSMIISEIDTRPVGGGAKFKNGDTLLARITPCLENGKTAFVQFMEDDNMVATGSTEFIVMRSTQVTPYWVYCLARSHNFRQHAINSMAGSDGRQRVKPDCFEQYQVLSPPPQILKKFDTIASPIFKQIKYLSWQNKKLKEARDLLLPRLINGSIVV